MTIAVLGAGAFGTALAIALAANEPVTLWARSETAAKEIDAARENSARLVGGEAASERLCYGGNSGYLSLRYGPSCNADAADGGLSRATSKPT